MAQLANSLPAVQKTKFHTWVRKIPWRKKWQPTSSILTWEISRTEEPGSIQPTGSERVGHDLGTKGTYLLVYMDIQQASPQRGRGVEVGVGCVTENFGLCEFSYSDDKSLDARLKRDHPTCEKNWILLKLYLGKGLRSKYHLNSSFFFRDIENNYLNRLLIL